ncbi:MAG: hypothetical protein LBI42_06870 [Chitinispirillales bacterium]|nr:hypothetical protein [Chitinispirillales bacterium]
MNTTKALIETSADKVEKWVEAQNYRGYEPFDGLSSFLKPVTMGNVFAERLLQQLVRQSPVNLRPLFGISRKDSTKGRGYMAWGYIRKYKMTGDEQYLKRAADCFEWLDKNKAPGYVNHSWGNHFDFTSRAGRLPRHEPIIVWSSLIGQAFLDAYEEEGNKRYLQIAKSICGWILDLPREKTASGDCLSYVAYTQSSIHNSNMLGAGLLGRMGAKIGDKYMIKVAKSAMEYSCSRQRKDGSWWYGEGASTRWIDNFHTAYNLDSLKYYIDYTGDKDYCGHLQKGFKYFKENFFEESGRPKYYHNRAYPIDIQCASQAIDTLANFSLYDKESLDLGVKVAMWTIKNMQDEKGCFYYRQYPGSIMARTPMLHWGQATMYKGLLHLASKLK